MKNNLEQLLLIIMVKEEGTIRSFIAQEALKRKPLIELFFRQLEKNGCESWMIETLVKYSDTYRFFNQHYHEIKNALLEYSDEEDGFFFQWNDLPRLIVWLAVYKIAKEMANDDLGLDD